MDTTRASGSSAIEVLLRDFALLDGLVREEIRILAASADRYSLSRGHVLFRQGAPCSALHLITQGQVKLSVQTARGDERVIELVGARGNLGAVALLMNQPYMTTAELIADSTFIELRADAIRKRLAGNVEFLQSVLREVCLRIRQRTRDLENCMLLTGTQRVADFLLGQLVPGSARAPLMVTLPAKKSIIASRLNLTQEHFSRILHEIQEKGLIEVHGRQIRVLDPARLRAFQA